jgi:hypothetical protein
MDKTVEFRMVISREENEEKDDYLDQIISLIRDKNNA